MTCERVKKLLSEYLDGELSPAVTDGVQSHLYRCPGCEAELQALRRTVQLLALYGRQRVPVDCRDAVLARIRLVRQGLTPLSTEGGGSLTGRLAGVFAWSQASGRRLSWAAAVLALACLGGGSLLLRGEGPGSPHRAPTLAQVPSHRLASGSSPAPLQAPVDSSLTPREELARVHAPYNFSQSMGRDDGIVLVSDWVEGP